MASLAEFSDAVKKEGKELQSLLHFKQMVRNFEESKSEFTQEEFDKYTDVVLDLSKALRTDTNPLTNAIERRHYISDINESLGYDISKNLTEILDTEELFRLSFLLKMVID